MALIAIVLAEEHESVPRQTGITKMTGIRTDQLPFHLPILEVGADRSPQPATPPRLPAIVAGEDHPPQPRRHLPDVGSVHGSLALPRHLPSGQNGAAVGPVELVSRDPLNDLEPAFCRVQVLVGADEHPPASGGKQVYHHALASRPIRSKRRLRSQRWSITYADTWL